MAPVDGQAARGNIVIVDDDELFLESVATNLINAGYATTTFGDGPAALQHLAAQNGTDIVLLDWKMPGMNGIEVLQRLRKDRIDVPVIFLTALNDQIYEEAGLLGGAVDFIEKSRSFSILLRRVELILGGSKAKPPPQGAGDILREGDLSLRRDSRRAFWKEAAVDLTLTEFNIVSHLIEHADRDVSYREIYDIVHGEGFFAGEGEIGYRTNVRAFIKRIRQKFRDIDPEFSFIRNYPGFGYRWRDD